MSINTNWPFELDEINDWAYLDNVFTKEECNKIIFLGNKNLKEANIFNDISSEMLLKDIRNSQISWITPNEETAWIYQKLTDATVFLNNNYFKFDLYGFNESLQFTKYIAPSGFYGAHIDKAYGKPIRKLSIVIQLSDGDDYEGGDLNIKTQDKEKLMGKSIGKMIAFPSYVLHEVKPVTKGTRYSLVAWISGKPFK